MLEKVEKTPVTTPSEPSPDAVRKIQRRIIEGDKPRDEPEGHPRRRRKPGRTDGRARDAPPCEPAGAPEEEDDDRGTRVDVRV